MTKKEITILESLSQQGISRRSFLKFCAVTASMLALPIGDRSVFTKAWQRRHDHPLSGYTFRNVPAVLKRLLAHLILPWKILF